MTTENTVNTYTLVSYTNNAFETPLLIPVFSALEESAKILYTSGVAMGRVNPAFVGDALNHLHSPCSVVKHCMGVVAIFFVLS